MPFRVAAAQVPDVREDIGASLGWIDDFTSKAESEGVSLICFPECFLQGYLTETKLAKRHAINLASLEFEGILRRLTIHKPVIVFGLIEEDQDRFFNTAVVVKDGVLVGSYRKTHLLGGEQLFTAGTAYPVFESNGLKFGINICFDTQFAESAAALACQGARLIVCPANNMMGYEKAQQYKYLHHQTRIERAKENGVWLLSADVTGERGGRVAYGPTSVLDPTGKIVAQVPLLTTGMAVADI